MIIDNFLEGKREQPPFFFMGAAWLPVMERAGAIRNDDAGNPWADGEAFRQGYWDFVNAPENYPAH